MKRVIKQFLKIIFMIISIFLVLGTGGSYAKDITTKKYIGITAIRTNDTPNMGYAIGDPNSYDSNGTATKLWNLVEHVSAGTNTDLKADGAKNIYCLKAGIGFENENSASEYNVFYDMRTEREGVKGQNNITKTLVEGNITLSNG